ncbi:tyrosine-type recombinase/integrase [Salinifilum ghardaiensis]
MTRSKARRKRPRGTVEELPSGALRVKVYAGFDPVTKRRHYLQETVPAGPQAHREAEKVQTRLLNQVDEQRNPRTAATVNQLVTRYLDQYFDEEPSTRQQYRSYLKHHIAPFIGEVKVGSLDVDALDSLHAELRRCRDLHRQAAEGSPHEGQARVRPPVRLARVHAARCDSDPPHSLPAVRGVQARRAVEVGRGEPGPASRTARVAAGSSEAAECRGSGPAVARGLAGPGLGHLAVDCDDHRCSPRRAVRASVARRGFRDGRALAGACDRRRPRAEGGSRRAPRPTSIAAWPSTRSASKS